MESENWIVFLEFSEIKKFFLTILIYIMVILYIDKIGFLFDQKLIRKNGLTVFSAIQTDLLSEN